MPSTGPERRDIPIALERILIRLDQIRLANRGDGLQLGQTGGTLIETQFCEPGSDRTTADHHNLATRVGDSRQLCRQQIDSATIQLAVFGRQHTRPHFDDHAASVLDRFAASRRRSSHSERGGGGAHGEDGSDGFTVLF